MPFGVVEQAQANFTMNHFLDYQIICVYLDEYSNGEYQVDKINPYKEKKNLFDMASVFISRAQCQTKVIYLGKSLILYSKS